MGVPVVLHHGIFGFDELRLGPVRVAQFPGVERALREAGHPTACARVHPCASIARRAGQLKQCLLQRLAMLKATERVILVAHSLGGLDARYMVSRLGMAKRVAAVVTISTPHRGASLADFWHLHLGRRLKVYDAVRAAGVDIGAAYDLTRVAMQRFNAEVPDHPDVRYYSVTCSVPWWRVRGKLLLPHRIVGREEGENDGIVSVSSAVWGEHLAHWPVDHIAAVNRPRLVPLPSGRAEVLGRYVEAVGKVAADLSRANPTTPAPTMMTSTE